MAALGLMVYGYSKDDADKIKASIDGILGEDTIVISATSKEPLTLTEILNRGPEESYADGEVKILVFIGFDDGQIHGVMGSLTTEVKRPIFCTLTENNINWPFQVLIEHLLEEQRHWAERDGRAGKGPHSS